MKTLTELKGTNMGIMKEKYIENQIAEETARKRLFHNFKEVPQHVSDEYLVDLARQHSKELNQMEMFDDDDWNWSGKR